MQENMNAAQVNEIRTQPNVRQMPNCKNAQSECEQPCCERKKTWTKCKQTAQECNQTHRWIQSNPRKSLHHEKSHTGNKIPMRLFSLHPLCTSNFPSTIDNASTSPGRISPLMISLATTVSTFRWMKRFSGRAPKSASVPSRTTQSTTASS